MKKLTALILVLVMLLSFVPLSAYAASTKLEVTSVSLTGKNAKRPLSKTEIKNYLNDGLGSYINDDNYEDIDLADFERYEFSLKLSNGKTIVISSDNIMGIAAVDNNHFAIVETYVSGARYRKALNAGTDYVYAYVHCCLYDIGLNDLMNNFNTAMEILEKPSFDKTFKVKFSLVEQYITKLVPVSGIPKSVYKGADYVELDGAKFSVTYYNGSTKTYAVKRNSPLNYDYNDSLFFEYPYTLNDEPFDCEIGTNKLYFTYADSPKASKAVTVKPCPYNKIEITDCILGANTSYFGKSVSSLSYRLYKTDGSMIEFKVDMDSPYFMGVAGEFDGYYVNYVATDASSITSSLGGNTEITVNFAGLTDTFNSSESSSASLLSKIIAKFEKILNLLESIFDSLSLPIFVLY